MLSSCATCAVNKTICTVPLPKQNTSLPKGPAMYVSLCCSVAERAFSLVLCAVNKTGSTVQLAIIIRAMYINFSVDVPCGTQNACTLFDCCTGVPQIATCALYSESDSTPVCLKTTSKCPTLRELCDVRIVPGLKTRAFCTLRSCTPARRLCAGEPAECHSRKISHDTPEYGKSPVSQQKSYGTVTCMNTALVFLSCCV